MTDLGRQPFQRAGDQPKRGEEGGVPVAWNDLRGNRFDVQAQCLRDVLLYMRIDICERADGAGNRAYRNLLARRDESDSGTLKFRIKSGQFEPEGGRLSMHTVAPA